MGAWGTGHFENDDAMDWIIELENSQDLLVLQNAFEVINTVDYREAPECCIALAAAEAVAAIRGRPAGNLPDEVSKYGSRWQGNLDETLLTSAVQAVNSIKSESELQELWAESDDLADWESRLDELLTRLS